MKLLVLTQRIDTEDPVLGFFHNWLEQIAFRCDSVTVICLGRGRFCLPANVSVLSLGKESGRNRLKYLINFYRYVWRARNDYDKVFVHMNPEYLVLGGWLWLFFRKPAYLWYNHIYGNWIARWGKIFASRIFYTSPTSFFSASSKGVAMPVGIDTDVFNLHGQEQRQENSLLSLGRISPVKNLEILIEAMKNILNIDIMLTIIGDTLDGDKDYLDVLKMSASDLVTTGKISFAAAVPNYLTPGIYRQYDMFINSTNSGSLDKAILEAMACGCLTIISNTSLAQVLPPEMLFQERDSVDLSRKIEQVSDWSKDKKESVRISLARYVEEHHSLNLLMEKIFFYLRS